MVVILVLFLSYLSINYTYADQSPINWSSPNGPYGGTVLSVEVCKANPKIIYAGSYNGLFKSSDEGKSWKKVSEAKYIKRIITHAKNENLVFIECNDGIFRSNNQGESWTNLNTKHRNLSINPEDINIIFATQGDWDEWNGEVYKSTNQGDNFFNLGKVSFLNKNAILNKVVFAKEENILYLTGGVLNDMVAKPLCGVYKSIDGGKRWSLIFKKEAIAFNFSIDPNDSRVLYFATNLGLDKSTNQGLSWTTVFNQSGVDEIVINPYNSQTIYLLTDRFRENPLGLFKSIDGGKNWFTLNENLPYLSLTSISLNQDNADAIYAGITGNGLFSTVDGGKNWQEISSLNHLIPDENVSTIATDYKNPSTMYVKVLSGICKSTNFGASWFKVGRGLPQGGGTPLLIDPNNSQVLYTGVDRKGIYKSTDSGENWSSVSYGLPQETIKSLLIDHRNSNILFCVVQNHGVYRTDNGGKSWSKKSEGISSPLGEVDSMVNTIGMDKKKGTLYAGVNNFCLYKSTNQGENWFFSGNGISRLVASKEIVVDPNDSSVVYDVCDNEVYKSTNEGEFWFKIRSPKEPQDNLGLLVHPENSHLLILGSILKGLFISQDGGRNWSELPDELAKEPLCGMALNHKDPEDLYISKPIYEGKMGGVFRGNIEDISKIGNRGNLPDLFMLNNQNDVTKQDFQYSEYEPPPTITGIMDQFFCVPHPDDETIGMGLNFKWHQACSWNVYSILFTWGEQSDVFYWYKDCGYARYWLQPPYSSPADRWDFGKEREIEWHRAMDSLGVGMSYRGIWGGPSGMKDKSVSIGSINTPNTAKYAFNYYAYYWSGVHEKTVTRHSIDPITEPYGNERVYYDYWTPHPDHYACFKALDSLFEDPGYNPNKTKIRSACFYKVSVYLLNNPSSRWNQMMENLIAYRGYKRSALVNGYANADLNANPPRFGIGYRSMYSASETFFWNCYNDYNCDTIAKEYRSDNTVIN